MSKKEMATTAPNGTVTEFTGVPVFGNPNYGERFTSFSPDDIDGKIMLYNAINSPGQRVKEMINKEITIRDVVVCRVTLSDKKDSGKKSEDEDIDDDDNPFVQGKGRTGFRTILIDMDGNSYAATSTGIYNSVSTMLSVFGTLHFDKGLRVVVNQIEVKNGNTLTLEIVR